MWANFVNHIGESITAVANTAQLFWAGIVNQISIIAVIDVLLVFALLWWIYKRLRRTELIKVFPRVFLLLLLMLVARIVGLFTLFYVTGAVLVIVLLALGALYAPEIKNMLEMSQIKIFASVRRPHTSPSDVQSIIKALGEAFSVLTRARKPALVVIRGSRPVTRLVENGTKMNSQIKSELIIDFFTNGSMLGKGAVVIDGNRIVSVGSTLFKKNSKILFNTSNPAIKKVAKELGAIVVIANRTVGDISLLHGDDVYKRLTPPELVRVLQTILVYS